MKIARMLFKPRWQDKDPAVRAAAVAADAEPELIAALPELTRSDADPRVRLAALKRLGDYERWRERSTADADAGVRGKARAVYIGMLCAGGKTAPALQRLVSELETLSPGELETVAATASDRDLRRAAMTYISRPALVAERAIADPDPQLRLAALERIVDIAVLERIAERTRKSDKTVSRHARERIEALRIGSGDAGAIAARARQLCERMEALLRNPASDAGTRAAEIATEWQTLDASARQSLGARFDGAAALVARLTAAATADRSAEPVEPADTPSSQKAGPDAGAVETSPVPTAEAAPPGDADDAAAQIGDAVVSRARFDAAVAAAAEHTRRDRERHVVDQREIERLAESFAAQLDGGDLAAANATHAKLAELSAAGAAARSAIDHRLARHEARYAELKRWQHWSNQRRRRALCEEIEALGAAGLHPDAVATKVHDARTEWQRLDAMEGHGGEGAGLTRRFFGACQRALKPARAYFEKRDAVRDTHRSEIDALLARAAVPASGEDWKAMNALRHELGAALRSVSTLDPRDRHVFARRLKAAIAALAPRLEEHARGIEEGKQRLIAQAQALAAKADRSATRGVRDLQQQWTALGSGARGTDQKQWREFRSACDAVFGALDADRRQRDEHLAEQTTRAQALVERAEATAADATLAGDALGVRRRELESAWRELAADDRRLEQRFQRAAAGIEQRIAQVARQSKLARYANALERYRALLRIERGEDDAAAEWDSSGLSADFAAALAARRSRRNEAGGVATEAVEAARDALVRLEFLAGAPSPADDRERRMNYQVSRLSARLRGGATVNPESELTGLLLAWFALRGPLPPELERRFDAASDAALSTLP